MLRWQAEPLRRVPHRPPQVFGRPLVPGRKGQLGGLQLPAAPHSGVQHGGAAAAVRGQGGHAPQLLRLLLGERQRQAAQPGHLQRGRPAGEPPAAGKLAGRLEPLQ